MLTSVFLGGAGLLVFILLSLIIDLIEIYIDKKERKK